MGIPDSKNILASIELESGECWFFFNDKSGYIPQTYEAVVGDPYIQTFCYAPGKPNWTTSDYVLFSLVTSRRDPSVNDVAPVLVLSPNQDSASSLPLQGSIFESLIGLQMNYDEKTETFLMSYWVYGWTITDTENDNFLASDLYSEDRADGFDEENWWVVQQQDDFFPVYSKANLVSLFCTGKRYNLDEDLSYLIFNYPKVVRSVAQTGDTCCAAFVQPTSTTKNANGYYPGIAYSYDVVAKQFIQIGPCWILDANS